MIALFIADAVIRWRWIVLAITLLIVFVVGSGMRYLEFANNYRVFFSKENPDLIAFDDFQDTYTKNDNFLYVLKPSQGRIFTPNSIDAVEELTQLAWKIPYAIRVDSITNFQHSWADGDDLTVDDLVRNGKRLSKEELEHKEAVALAEPLLKGNLLSQDAKAAGVNVTLQYPERSIDEVPIAMNYARKIAEQIETKHPEIQIAISGVSALNNAFAESTAKDSTTLFPLMFIVLILVTFFSTRTVVGTIATFFVIGFSTIIALGFAGFFGIPLSPFSSSAPVVILTLAIADSIHILATFRSLLQEGRSKNDALIESIRMNFLAVSITSLTTIVGFLALNFSDAPPFKHLGNLSAMGIAAAWLFSLTLLLALMSLLPITAHTKKKSKQFHAIRYGENRLFCNGKSPLHHCSRQHPHYWYYGVYSNS